MTQNPPGLMQAVIRWTRRLLAVAFGALAVTVLALGLGARLGPLIGLELYAIRSGSMSPAMAVGALAVVERGWQGDAKGQIVAIRQENGVVVTHRVVEVVEADGGQFLRTRGDANKNPDPTLVSATAIQGRVALSTPILGFLLGMLGMPIGVVSILSTAAAFIVAIWLLEDLEVPVETDFSGVVTTGAHTRPT